MNAIDTLTQLFAKLPGVGNRQARRFVYFLLHKEAGFIRELREALSELETQAQQCGRCFRVFVSSTSGVLCTICADADRDITTLMVVERESDLEAVHKSGVYTGRFFVIGGALPVLEKNPEGKLRIRELKEELRRAATEDGLREVVFALSATPEGEHTTQYLLEVIAPIADEHGVQYVQLGRGLSTGTELEYSDTDTLKNALHNRQ